MKTNSKLGLLIIAATILFSCKKEAAGVSSLTSHLVSSEASSDAIPAESKWFGIYADGYSSGIDTVADVEFIGNGIATLQNSPWYYYYTNISLPVTGRNISGDSLKFEAMLKNPDNEAGSVFPYDVSLWIHGAKHTSHVQFLADLQQYTGIFVDGHGISNTSKLIHKFQDWTDLSLEAKDKKLFVYINGVLQLKVSYEGLKIGRIQQITIAFKGGGSVDWVKLFNSKSGNQIMQEDFNSNGSNVIWY